MICTTCKFWQLVEHGRKRSTDFWWTAHWTASKTSKTSQKRPSPSESRWDPLGCFLMLESIGICSWPVVAASHSQWGLQKPDETIAARRGYTLCLGALGVQLRQVRCQVLQVLRREALGEGLPGGSWPQSLVLWRSLNARIFEQYPLNNPIYIYTCLYYRER